MEGLSVTDLTPDIASELEVPAGTKGVVVTSADPDRQRPKRVFAVVT